MTDIIVELIDPSPIEIEFPVAGVKGDPGVGVPPGGTTGQVLAKDSNDDYDTEWVNPSGGSGAVDSVNGQTGTVELDAEDIPVDTQALVDINPSFAGVEQQQQYDEFVANGLTFFGASLAYLFEQLNELTTNGIDKITRTVTNVNHGLTPYTFVRLEDGSESTTGHYVLSDNTSLENSKVDGFVFSVIDDDHFVMLLGGYITDLVGLIADRVYYLSNVPGEMTPEPPTTLGSVVKPIFQAVGSTRGVFWPNSPAYVIGDNEPRDRLNVLLSLEDRTDYALVGGGAAYDTSAFHIPNGGDFSDGGIDCYTEIVPLWGAYFGVPEDWNFQEIFTIEDDSAWGGDLVEAALCWKGRNPVPFFELTAADSATENGSGNGYGEYPGIIYSHDEYNGEMFFLQRIRYTYDPDSGTLTLYRPAVAGETVASTAFGVDWVVAHTFEHQNPGSHPIAPIDPTKPLRVGKGAGRCLVSRVTVNSFDGTPYCDFYPSDNTVDENTVYDPVLDDNWVNTGSGYAKALPVSRIVSNWFDQSSGGIESIVEGTNIEVDDTDPANPIVGLDTDAQGGILLAHTALQSSNNLSEITGADNRGSARYNLRVPTLFNAVNVYTSNVSSLSGAAAASDGVTPANGDVVLLVAQTTASQNGPWTVNTGGAWTRPTDFPNSGTVRSRLIQVASGTRFANSFWGLAASSAITIDTTAQVWNLIARPSGIFPNIRPTTGDWYSMVGQTSAGTAGITSAGLLRMHPLWLEVGTIDRIAVSTSVAAVSTWRLGLYKASPLTDLCDGQPPFLDAGTVDMNATAGVQAVTISQAITEAGLYWAAILCDAYTAQPTTHNVTYSSNSGVGIQGLPQDAFSLSRYRVGRSYGSYVATGSIPTCPTSSMSWNGLTPRVMVRYA